MSEVVKAIAVVCDDNNVSYGELFDAAQVLVEEVRRLKIIVRAAWNVRREEKDYNQRRDLTLWANARQRLHKLLDAWKAANPAERE